MTDGVLGACDPLNQRVGRWWGEGVGRVGIEVAREREGERER